MRPKQTTTRTLYTRVRPLIGFGYDEKQASRVEAHLGEASNRGYDLAYCEGFAANLVSFKRLRKLGYWWDTRPKYYCLRRRDDSVVAYRRDS